MLRSSGHIYHFGNAPLPSRTRRLTTWLFQTLIRKKKEKKDGDRKDRRRPFSRRKATRRIHQHASCMRAPKASPGPRCSQTVFFAQCGAQRIEFVQIYVHSHNQHFLESVSHCQYQSRLIKTVALRCCCRQISPLTRCYWSVPLYLHAL